MLYRDPFTNGKIVPPLWVHRPTFDYRLIQQLNMGCSDFDTLWVPRTVSIMVLLGWKYTYLFIRHSWKEKCRRSRLNYLKFRKFLSQLKSGSVNTTTRMHDQLQLVCLNNFIAYHATIRLHLCSIKLCDLLPSMTALRLTVLQSHRALWLYGVMIQYMVKATFTIHTVMHLPYSLWSVCGAVSISSWPGAVSWV